MRVQSRKPCPALAPFVQAFCLREAQLGTAKIYQPLPARTDSLLEFYLHDAYRIVDVASGAVHSAPRSVVVGPHTRRREDILYTGSLKVFTIKFSATGFRTLFGIPAHLITDRAESSSAVLNTSIAELEERLACAGGVGLCAIAESFLLRQLRRNRPPHNTFAVAEMVRSLQSAGNGLQVAAIARQHHLSVRQVERSFQEIVGLAPRMVGRLSRLKIALSLSRGSPAPDWAHVAAAAGYFDQSHMIRDFRALVGETPARFLALHQMDVASVLSNTSRLAVQ